MMALPRNPKFTTTVAMEMAGYSKEDCKSKMHRKRASRALKKKLDENQQKRVVSVESELRDRSFLNDPPACTNPSPSTLYIDMFSRASQVSDLTTDKETTKRVSTSAFASHNSLTDSTDTTIIVPVKKIRKIITRRRTTCQVLQDAEGKMNGERK